MTSAQPCTQGIASARNSGTSPKVGDRVRVQRDERCYPARGSWAQFRGRIGTVVVIIRDRARPDRTEFGVTFGKASAAVGHNARRVTRWDPTAVVWFRPHEVCPLDSAQARHGCAPSLGTQMSEVH